MKQIIETPTNPFHLLLNDFRSRVNTAIERAPECPYCGQPRLILLDEAGARVYRAEDAAAAIVPRFHNCPGGLAAYAADEAAREREEALRTAGQLIVKLNAGKYDTYRFGTWDAARTPTAAGVAEKVQRYAAAVIAGQTRRWLWLHGPYGTGKTHLAVAATRQIAGQGLVRPQVVVWPQICSRVKESWGLSAGEAGETEGQIWGTMRGAGILLLDDIDKIDTTSWAIQKLFEVIDYRVVQQRPTLITANHSLVQLRRLWGRSKKEHIADTGAAILSRIEGELFTVVEFAGADQRRQC